MDHSSSRPRRYFERGASRGALLLWGINAAGLPLAVAVNTPTSIWGWLGAALLEVLFVLALLDMWVMRRR